MYHHIASYNQAKQKFEETKPIRGRKTDIRPLERRREDWKTIVQVEGGYACRLYESNCVTYYEDGRVVVDDHGHRTITSASFIQRFSPFNCFKSRNYLWLSFAGRYIPLQPKVGFSARYMVNEFGETVFRGDPIKILTKSVNRQRAKQLRSRLDPFIKYCTAMLKLSDGWLDKNLYHDAMRTIAEWDYVKANKDQLPYWRISGIYSNEFINYVINNPSDDNYLAAMCFVAQTTNVIRADRAANRNQYSLKRIKNTIIKLHDRVTPEVYDDTYIEPSGKMPSNLPDLY